MKDNPDNLTPEELEALRALFAMPGDDGEHTPTSGLTHGGYEDL